MFQDLCTYVGFTEDDSEGVRALAPLVAPHYGRIIDRFYQAILGSPGARAVLQDEAQVVRLKETLLVWLRELFEGPHDEAYFQRRMRIGHAHVRVGLPIQYMVTAISVIRQATTEVLLEQGVVDPQPRFRFGKLLDLDLAIMLTTYAGVREQAARVGGREEMAAEYAEIFDSARAAILQLDVSGRILAANLEAERLCGRSRERLLGAELLPHIHPADRAWMRAVLVASSPEGAASMLQCRCLLPSGRERHVDWTLAHMQGPDGPRRVLVGIDVTERVLLQERARAAERLATIGQMSAILAHEIRNPLNAATLQLTLLQRSLRGDDTAAGKRALQAATVVQTEIRRLETLVTEFLGFARPTHLERAAFSVRELVDEMTPLVGELVESRAARIQLDLPDDLPLVDVDRARIIQVLLNLVNNSLDAMAEKPGTITVRARTDGESMVRLDILDEGQGVSSGDFGRVFEPFFTTKAKGTGLGLAVVRRIVEDHHGSVSMQNRESGGLMVTVHLPVARRETDGERADG